MNTDSKIGTAFKLMIYTGIGPFPMPQKGTHEERTLILTQASDYHSTPSTFICVYLPLLASFCEELLHRDHRYSNEA